VHLGYKVLSAETAKRPLCGWLSRKRPALAVLDVIMPKLGGTAVATQLTERFPDLPVIFHGAVYSQDAANLPAGTGE